MEKLKYAPKNIQENKSTNDNDDNNFANDNDDDNDKGDDGKLFCGFESITMSSHYVKPYQPTIICSKLTLETLEQDVKYVQS